MRKFFKSISCLLLAALMCCSTACLDFGDSSISDSNSNSVTSEQGGGTEQGGTEQGGNSGETSNLAQYSINETVQKLSNSVYADAGMKDDGRYGLSDISNVGVIQSEADKELYPIELSGEYATIEYSEMTGTNDFERLSAAFSAAKAANTAGKKAVINLPENGVLSVNASLSGDSTFAFNLSGYDGLYINGNGCKVMLTFNDFAFRGFINIYQSKDVHINDLSVDYEVPTAISGMVSAIDKENMKITVDIPAEFNETVKRVKASGESLKSYVEFNEITRAPLEGGNFCTASEGFITGHTISGDETEGYKIVVQFGEAYTSAFSDKAEGHYAALAFSMYVYNGFVYDNCEDVYMENVTLHTCPGMGVVGRRTTNIFVNRMKIALPENSQRLMTTTADGFHFAECYGEVKVTNSLVEYTHDDALNIKSGYYYGVTSVSRQKEITIVKKTEGISKPEVGNVIEFYDKNTFEKLGSYTITEMLSNVGESSYTFKVKEAMASAMGWDLSNVVATNISKTAKFTFTNNIVRNKRNRGILVQVRDALISNNAFFNVGHGSISIHSSLDVFNEATMPKNIKIENNKLVNNNYLMSLAGDIYVFARSSALGPVGTISEVSIKNNFIAKNGNAGVSLQACSDSAVENNLFYDNARVKRGELYDCAVELSNSGDLSLKGNYVYNTLDSATYAGIITGGLTDTTTIVLQDNVNLAYQVIEVETTTTEVLKLLSDVTIDGNVDEWATQGTPIAMIGHSLADGGALDPTQYTSYFNVDMCKIAWNENGIYIAFDIKDDTYDFKTVNNFWNGDCFEMFASTILTMANADMQLYKNDDGDVMQMACVPTWDKGWTFASARTGTRLMEGADQVQAKCVKTSKGYAGEVFLPFSLFTNMKACVDNGEEIAMAFVFADNDRDDLGLSRLQVSNVPHFVEAWKTKTAKMPLFKFVEALSESAE